MTDERSYSSLILHCEEYYGKKSGKDIYTRFKTELYFEYNLLIIPFVFLQVLWVNDDAKRAH